MKKRSALFKIKEILNDFPESKFIHVLRDPRDNYFSLKRRMYDKTSAQYDNPSYNPLSFISNRILSSLTHAHKNMVYFDNYFVIKYENLIYGQKEFLADLISKIGLAWDDSLLIPTIEGENWFGNSTDPTLKSRLNSFDTRPIGKWVSNLDKNEKSICEWIIYKFNFIRYLLSKK